jgi:hypothetical protein
MLPLAFAVLCLAPAEPPDDDAAARAIVTRALAARGGGPVAAGPVAVYTRFKNTTHVPNRLEVTGEMFIQPGPATHRYEMHVSSNGEPYHYTHVIDGPRSWQALNGIVGPLPEDSAQSQRDIRYANHLANLWPLLREEYYSLATLAPRPSEGRMLVGVRVGSSKRNDVRLWFDKADGLLREVEYFGGGAAKRIVFSDYREPDWTGADEKRLKLADAPTDGPGLVAYLRGRTPGPAEVMNVKTLVRQLGDRSFAVRERATAGLVALGRVAVPYLRPALDDADPEVSRRAQRCLERLAAQDDGTLPAAVRVLAWRKPDGAASALLDYIAVAPDGADADEVRSALAEVALRDGKPDPVLVAACASDDPARRSAARAALWADGPVLDAPGRRLYPAGLKYPHKYIRYSANQLETETEFVEVGFFNRFDDSRFAKPGG